MRESEQNLCFEGQGNQSVFSRCHTFQLLATKIVHIRVASVVKSPVHTANVLVVTNVNRNSNGPKGQLISKCFFVVLNFFQKNERKHVP